MSGEHEESLFCYLSGKYFGTKKLLKNHSKNTHGELQDITESECEENVQDTKDKKKAKKKNKNKRSRQFKRSMRTVSHPCTQVE